MNCTNCGSPLNGRPGYCGTCGQPLSFPTAPPPPDETAVLPVIPPHAEPHSPPTSIPLAPQYHQPASGYGAHGLGSGLGSGYGETAPAPAYGEPTTSYDQPTPGPFYGQPAYDQQAPTYDQQVAAYGPPTTAYPVSPPPASYPPAGQLYGPPPVQPYPAAGQYYGEPLEPPRSPGNALSIVAMMLAAIAIFILPIVFGIAGIVSAAIARKRGESLGPLSLKVAIAGTALGVIVGVSLAILT